MALSKLEHQILNILQEKPEQAYSTQDLANQLNYQSSKKYKRLVKALAFLERTGHIQLTSRGKFKSKENLTDVTGTYRANERGFGFIQYDEEEEDLFVPKGRSGGAMDGDLVEARIIKAIDPRTGKGSEAQVTKVLERNFTQVVGEFHQHNQELREETGYIGFVEPQGNFSKDTLVYIRPDGIHPANSSIVTVEITAYPTSDEGNYLEGIASREIGHKNAPGVDILTILYQFDIPSEFPEEVIKEAEAVPQTIAPEDYEGRKDLRDQLTMTIDGADAKDLDDAISLEVLEDHRYKLGVHIADVSHYVPEGSAIDAEAFERGTSVYLTDRVVPMLPQRLSNGICSLNPKEDRLTLTCEMIINQAGKVERYHIFPSVIHSDYRLTYDEVNGIIDGDEVLRQTYEDIADTIDQMTELHHILEGMREKRGAINFDTEEAIIEVDEEGHPIDIQARERKTGEKLIESFMLIANETVAKEFKGKDLPFIYRIHEQPDSDRLDNFAEFITSFGLVLRGNTEKMPPKKLQEVMSKVEDQPYEAVVSMMLLRSMQQAKYSEEAAGHYGLAATDYTHFTSPIRRYPDLTVHRLIHRYAKGRPNAKERHRLEDRLPIIAEQSSKRERRAIEAERETDALKKTEYMVDKVGEQFDGFISSVTNFGFFVQLPNTIEGLVRLEGLDDYYQYHQDQLILVGERSGRILQIGQAVTVEVSNVSVPERQIDFKLISAEASTTDNRILPPQGKSKGKRRGKAPKNQAKHQNKKQRDAKKKKAKSKGKFKIRRRK